MPTAASRESGTALAAGLIEAGSELVVESLMPSGGTVFSDGVEGDFLAFDSGTVVRIGAAEERARLVVPDEA